MGGDLKGILEALVVGPFCTRFSSPSPHSHPFLTFSLGFREATPLRSVGAKPGKAAGGRPEHAVGGTTTTLTSIPRAAAPLPEPLDSMAAPEEPGSPTEAPQPAVEEEEEETKTFKDLVRVVSLWTAGARRRQRPVALDPGWW